jgi:hypothetical protein
MSEVFCLGVVSSELVEEFHSVVVAAMVNPFVGARLDGHLGQPQS